MSQFEIRPQHGPRSLLVVLAVAAVVYLPVLVQSAPSPANQIPESQAKGIQNLVSQSIRSQTPGSPSPTDQASGSQDSGSQTPGSLSPEAQATESQAAEASPRTGSAVPGPPPAAATGPPGAAEPAPVGLYVGVSSCASTVCHGSTVPRESYPVLQNEYYTWLQQDRHAQAYNVLFNERSRAIARNLRLGPAHEAQRCLDCHALTAAPAKRAGRLEIEDGVSCESCHGPASGWLEGHRSEGWGHGDSVEAGMRDLRDVAVRAELCLSCHLGTPGRSVDHALLAAGHPVLTFELDNYTASLPPHWPPAADRDDPARRRQMLASHGARAWALGQARSFRAGLEQLGRRARRGIWPELAELRCDSCHHSLAEERWRNPLGAGEKPGLPRWSPARWAVLRPLLAVAAPRRVSDLDQRLARLADLMTDLGASRQQVAEVAEGAAAVLAEAEGALSSMAWDEGRSRQLLRAVAEIPPPADFDTAAQTLLAVNSLASEILGGRAQLASSSGLVSTIDAMDQALRERPSYDADRFAGLLERLETQVRRLPR